MEEPQATSSAPPAAAANTGLEDNMAGALAYLTFVPAVLFLILEPYNKRPFVRFNAFQCLGLYAVGMAGSIVCAVIPFLGWFVLAPLLGLTLICTFIFCIIKTYSGTRVTLPLIGNYAEKFANQ
jgi:uncharacterized membrane protein